VSTTRPALVDRTTVGTLDVPRLAVGTIAWTPETPQDEAHLASVARAAAAEGLDFFDTVRAPSAPDAATSRLHPD
jgi:aryl-alcohol dehydrogenase-like predicted oxidoreductase